MKLGFVINVLDEEYQNAICAGIKKRTEELGIDLFCIQQDNSKNIINSLLEKYPSKDYLDLDGIILLNSVMADCFTFKAKDDVQKLWGNLPVLSLGQKIEEVPSILIQTDYSMKQLVEHLISVHKYKNFVFLAGPENHHDAIRRKEIFLKTMEAYKPWFSELNYVVKTGVFSEVSALKMMNEVYEENPGFNPDVVVCSTDNMAIGVYKFFKMNRNSSEIKECAVTGFDDIPQSRYEIPSITTVRQPLEKMGIMAVNEIIKLIEGEQLPKLQFIESEVIFRESCGCNKDKANEGYKKQLFSDLQVEYVFTEQMLRSLSRFESNLNESSSREDLRFYIDSNISQLDLKNFCVLLMQEKNNQYEFEPFYVMQDGVNLEGFYDYQSSSFTDFKQKFLKYSHKNDSLNVKYLIANNQVFGVVIYDCNLSLNTYMSSWVISISQAITRILNNEEKQKYSKYLEEEVEKRTHQLLEANNKRMEVEAEVLKISELERQRFSNDLHDDICQRLAGISMLCRSYSNQQKPIEKNQMIELAELISDTLTTTRQYAHNSYPVELESLGLNYALNNLCNSFEKQTGINCTYIWNVKDSMEFESVEKLNLFRIIQEGLHNILKHAKAKNVSVILETKENRLEVSIKDDGIGFSVGDDEKHEGLGINSMKYRANQISACFEIKKNNPNGTFVFLSMLEKQNKTENSTIE